MYYMRDLSTGEKINLTMGIEHDDHLECIYAKGKFVIPIRDKFLILNDGG